MAIYFDIKYAKKFAGIDIEFFVQHHPNYKLYKRGFSLKKTDKLVICVYLQLAAITEFCKIADIANKDWQRYQDIYSKSFDYINKNYHSDRKKNTYIFYPDIAPLMARENSKLLLYNSWETRDLFRCYGVLRHWCHVHHLPIHKVIFSTTDHKHIRQRPNLLPHISSYDWQYIRACRIFSPSNIATTSIPKAKYILFMNNRCNQERFCTAAYLFSLYREKCHISFMNNKRSNKITPSMRQYARQFVPSKNIQSFIQKIPLKLDLGHSTKSYLHFVEESYIMLIFETNIVKSGVQQISEKTYRPILAGIPFILWGSQGGILEHLHYMGFQTFSPIINESYDDKRKSYSERYNILLNELKRICCLSAKDMQQLYLHCLPRVKHNLTHLQEKRISNFLF